MSSSGVELPRDLITALFWLLVLQNGSSTSSSILIFLGWQAICDIFIFEVKGFNINYRESNITILPNLIVSKILKIGYHEILRNLWNVFLGNITVIFKDFALKKS